jgi:hypothetical protein
MKKAVAALLLGACIGYYWGYGEGFQQRPSVIERTLDKFGASKLKKDKNARERNLQEASRP